MRNPGAETMIYAEHTAIFERIAAHDPNGAAEAMETHLTRANQKYHLV